MKLLSIGFGSMISQQRIISIINPDSAPIKRLIQTAKKKDNLIDATCGRKTQSVILMDSGHIILSAFSPDTIAGRAEKNDVL